MAQIAAMIHSHERKKERASGCCWLSCCCLLLVVLFVPLAHGWTPGQLLPLRATSRSRLWLLGDELSLEFQALTTPAAVRQRLTHKGWEFQHSLQTDQQLLPYDMEKVHGFGAHHLYLKVLMEEEEENSCRIVAKSDSMLALGYVAVVAKVVESLSLPQVMNINPRDLARQLGLQRAMDMSEDEASIASIMQVIQSQIHQTTRRLVVLKQEVYKPQEAPEENQKSPVESQTKEMEENLEETENSLSSAVEEETLPLSLSEQYRAELQELPLEALQRRVAQKGLAFVNAPQKGFMQKVQGCMGNVYVQVDFTNDKIVVQGTSDNMHARGLLVMLQQALDEATAAQVLAWPPHVVPQWWGLTRSERLSESLSNLLQVVQYQLHKEWQSTGVVASSPPEPMQEAKTPSQAATPPKPKDVFAVLADEFRGLPANQVKQRILQKASRYSAQTNHRQEYHAFNETYSEFGLMEKVHGSFDNVYLKAQRQGENRVRVEGTADSIFAQGLMALVVELVDASTVDQVLHWSPTNIPYRLGLENALSQGQVDALSNIVQAVQSQVHRQAPLQQTKASLRQVESSNPVVASPPKPSSENVAFAREIPKAELSTASKAIKAIAEEFKDRPVTEIQQKLVQKGLAYKRKQERESSVTSLDGLREKVPGCVANVYVQTTLKSPGGGIQVSGTADALVAQGLLAIVVQIAEASTPQDMLSLSPRDINSRLGLEAALSQGRNDGLANMIQVVQSQIHRELMSVTNDVDTSSATIDEKRNDSREEGPAKAVAAGEPNGKKVALLLSGGVDSSVALRLLLQDGYDVTPFYLRIWLEDELAHLGECPWEEDVANCMAVCEQAGIGDKLVTLSLQSEYKDRVMNYTLHEASQGRTPNPDILCNSRIKFGCFLETLEKQADIYGAYDYIASGHYAQVMRGEEGSDQEASGPKRLLRAPDPIKDQSYFLCALNQDQLSKLLFPIGHLQKQEVRALAEKFELPNRHRPDSQGLCFLGKLKFRDFLEANLGKKKGPIIDAVTQEPIGTHEGVWYHTVGQRKGIGPYLDPLATARGPWFVVAKDPKRNILFASNQYDDEAFSKARSEFQVEEIRWVNEPPPTSLREAGNDDAGSPTWRLDMKIRHGPNLASGTLCLDQGNGGVGTVRLDKKDGGLAPGQYVVFYHPGTAECFGCGIISEKHWAQFIGENVANDELSQPAKEDTVVKTWSRMASWLGEQSGAGAGEKSG